MTPRIPLHRQSAGSYVQSFQYGSTNARLMDFDNAFGKLKIFASTGGTTLAEYTEFTHTVPTWTKTYTYLGSSQLATVTPNGSGGEYVEFNHPDRLGTKLQTNQQGGTVYEQNTLPFGTALNAESTLTTNNKRFTSYDRSNATGLDYAVNRTYDSKQGRFTQVDPIGMQAVSLAAPQTLNMYTYCGNDPINYTDPSGLFFGSFFRWLGRLIMSLFRSKVAKKIAVRFVVSFVLSGGNFGVAIRSVMPDILRQLGLNPLFTPSWNPNLPYPITFGGVSPLSGYIIRNLMSAARNRLNNGGECWSISDLLKYLKVAMDEAWEASAKDGRERGGVVSSTTSGSFGSAHFPVGTKNEIDALPTYRDVRKRSETEGLVISFHTHPGGGRTPSGIAGKAGAGGDYGVMNKVDYLNGGVTMHPAPPYGIIKYGPKDSDVTVYDKNGIINPKNYGNSVGCFKSPNDGV